MTGTRPVPPLAPLPEPPPLPIARAALDTGLTVVAADNGGVPMVQLRLRVPLGASSEAEFTSATLLAATMAAGTERRTKAELAEAIQALGGRLSVGPDPDGLLISGEAVATRLCDLLDLVAEILTSATYPDGEVKAVRDRLASELPVAWSHPPVIARQALLRRLFGSHPYAREVPETERIAATGPEDVRVLHDRRVLPNASTLVLVGDVRADEALASAAEALSGWDARGSNPATPPIPPVQSGPLLLMDRPGAVQSSIRAGGHALPRSDPGYPALQLANTVLSAGFSSRLVANLREDKGYTYAPQSALRHGAAGASFHLEADVGQEVTAPAMLEIAYELGRIATLPVAGDELELARQYAIGAVLLGTATHADLANELLDLTTTGLDPEWLREHPRRLAAVTPDEVLEQAARFVAPSALTTIVLGDAGVIEGPLRRVARVEGPVATP